MTTFPGLPNQAQQQNPLSKFFRQPTIYFALPSQGHWWSPGALNMPVTGELAVYPMTSKDEILLRTPDALMNGQAMVDVIKSCIPEIVDPWKMPAIDVDSVLIAMRIASYGHQMDFEGTCPSCKETQTYAIDLRTLLDKISVPDYDQPFVMDILSLKFKPQIYQSLNRVNRTNFEIQRLAQSIDELDDTDENKVTATMTQMNRIVDMGHRVLAESTESITIMNPDGTPGDVVSDANYILDFYQNAGAKIIESIQKAYSELSNQGNIPPQAATCDKCNESYSMEITFDYANFFVRGS
jgi:hypothetical protein